MTIKPRYTAGLSKDIHGSHREFIDREEYKEIFKRKIDNKNPNNLDVLCFYGIGGIGKTSIRKELCRILDADYDSIWTVLDFELSIYRQEETALYYLRKTLKDKYKIQFPSFEIAYAVYWQKSHPHSPLNKESFPLIEDSGLLIDILSIASAIPFVRIIPNLAKTITKGKSVFRNWWTKRGQRELYNLPELEAKDILNRLPMYFASDLKDFLSEDTRKCVIFFDTYEAIWEDKRAEGGYFLRDAWIRELVAHLSEPLWVISGREKLRWAEIDNEWDNCTEHHMVGELSDSDSEKLLCSCGITDSAVRDMIVKSSKGVPHYLDLAVDAYFRIKQKYSREITAEDFSGTQTEIIDRFLKHLDRTEIETLKVLSVARTWNEDIVRMLINKFNIGFPFTALNDLYRFSFIKHHTLTDSYSMHELIRESIQAKIDINMLKEINKYLFDYYDNKLAGLDVRNISNDHCTAIAEAFFYGKNFLDVQTLNGWFEEKSEAFKLALRWVVIIPMLDTLLEMIRDKLGTGNNYFLKTAAALGSGLVLSGLYRDAISVSQEGVDLTIENPGLNNVYLEQIFSNLANAHYKLRDYSKAIRLFEKVLELKEKSVGEEQSDYASTLNNLALCHYELGRFEQAIKLKKQTVKILGKTKGENHPDYAVALINLAIVYKDMGQYIKAIELDTKALQITKNAYGENHPICAHSLNNTAIGYRDLGQYEKAVELHIKAASILRDSVGENHPDYATILTNLAVDYLDLKEYQKAFELNEKILKLKEQTIGKGHPEYALTLNNLAVVYMETKDYETAGKLFEDVISIFKNTIDMNDISNIEPLVNLAFCCLKLRVKDKPYDLCRQALTIFANLNDNLKPPLLGTLKKIENIYIDLAKHDDAKTISEEISKLEEVNNRLSGKNL